MTNWPICNRDCISHKYCKAHSITPGDGSCENDDCLYTGEETEEEVDDTETR